MPKFGKCPKCTDGARQVPLIGGLCYAHWTDSSQTVERSALQTIADGKKQVKKSQAAWFKEQVKQIPKCCENCKKKITVPAGMPASTPVAHIVPKSTVKSVATHDSNRWFACWQCHSDYDSKLPGEQAKMPIAKQCKERYQQFKNDITATELKHVPEWLKG